jgi:thiol-disulfide isomerase/thioredoxin
MKGSLPRSVGLVLLGVVIGAALARVQMPTAVAENSAATYGFNSGDEPPPWTALDTLGRSQSVKQYKGKLVVLHFWATWCPYCRSEIPKLKQVQQEFGSDVVILAVSVDEDVASLKEFVAKNQLSYVVIPDVEDNMNIATIFGIEGIPATYVIGPDGRILRRNIGPGDLVGAVRQAIAPPQSPRST